MNEILGISCVFILFACILVIAFALVMLNVRLARTNNALSKLLQILKDNAAFSAPVKEADGQTEGIEENKIEEAIPEAHAQAPVQEEVPAQEEVVEEKIVLEKLPQPQVEEIPELVNDESAAEAPKEPSQFQKRLVALKNWFIFGRQEGAGEGNSMEKMIATTWLLRSAILVLLFSSAFLLKLSIERGLLGPEGRVALSYLCGAVLLCLGLHGKLRERYWSLGQALAGIGLGVLYFSSFAMVSMYSLAPVYVGFAVMILITLTAGLLADRLLSLPIAMVSLIGGYATPLMLSTGQKNIPGLACYLLLLGGGVLWLSCRRNWQQLNLLGIVFTYGIFLLVYTRQFIPADFAAYQTGLALFLLLFSTSIFIYNLRRRIPAGEVEIIGLLLNSGIFFALSMLAIRRVWPDERLMAAPLTLGLSLLYLLHTVFFSKLNRVEYRNVLLIFCALSGLFLSLTFPAVLSGHWLGAAWALEALVMLWLAGKLGSSFIRSCSWLLYLCTLLRLIAYEFSFYERRMPVEQGQGFWWDCLARCCQFLIPVICLALGARMTLGQQDRLKAASHDENETPECKMKWDCSFVSSGIFCTLSFLLCFIFLRLEIATVLNYSLRDFALAGINLVWVCASILALLLLNRNVPGWWKWIFSICAPLFLLQCILDFIQPALWRWSCIEGTIANTAIVTLGIWYASRKMRAGHFPLNVARFGSIIWPVLLFLHSTREVHTIVKNKIPGLTGGGVSLLWAIFAFALVIDGLRRSVRASRYIGLSLFAVVVVKVFFYDIENLDALYRVLSFLAFGILLLGAAFLYLKLWHGKERQP